jgi:hypothetical protein
MAFGRSEAQAREWVRTTDAANAKRIEAVAAHADRQLWWSGSSIRFKDT